jgi:hypothetical protein
LRKFTLNATGFHAGALRYRGETVTLRDDETPGEHMTPFKEPEKVVPVVVPQPAPAAAIAPVHIAAAMAAAAITQSEALEPTPRLEPPARGSIAPAAPSCRGFLILDTETNGFKDPRMAAAAMIFATPTLEIESGFEALVKPDGWTMGAEAQAVNGLSQERLEAQGMDGLGPLMVFETALRLGYVVVAHNAAFDMKVLRAEARRRMLAAGLMPYPYICTMIAARAMIGAGKLETAYEKLLGEPMTGMHEAGADARACLEILRAMVKRGLDLRVVGRDEG